MAERAHCIYCHDELWSHLERGGVCCSCQGRPLDEGSDSYWPETRGGYADVLDDAWDGNGDDKETGR